MKPKNIMELIFIFILPLLFILPCVSIHKEYVYDNDGNFETSELSIDYNQSLYQSTYNQTIYSDVVTHYNFFEYPWSKEDTFYFSSDTTTIFYGEYKGDYTSYSLNGTQLVKDSTGLITTYDYDDVKTINNVIYYGYTISIFIDPDFEDVTDNGYYLITQTSSVVTKDTPFKIIHDLIVDNLYLNDTIVVDIIIDYTIIWFVMFILWHFFYLFFDTLVHLFIDWRKKE